MLVTAAPGDVFIAGYGVVVRDGDALARSVFVELRLPRVLLAALTGAVLGVSGRVFGSFAEQFSRDHARMLKLCLRFGLIALEQVNHAFKESLWGWGSSRSIHRFTAESFQDLKSIWKFPLQR